MGREMQSSVLIVEATNPAYFDLAKRGFKPEKVAKFVATHTQAIRDLSEDALKFRAVVCDLDAFGTTREIREALAEVRYYGGKIPIIARTEPEDRRKLSLDPIGSIAILEAGADNILPKTSDPELLPTYINALNRRQELNRNGLLPSEPITINRTTVDFTKRQILGEDGQEVHLTNTQWRILTFMVGFPNSILGHDRILTSVWGSEYRDDTQFLRGHISRFKKHLPGLIVTKPGVGYMLEMEIMQETETEEAERSVEIDDPFVKIPKELVMTNNRNSQNGQHNHN